MVPSHLCSMAGCRKRRVRCRESSSSCLSVTGLVLTMVVCSAPCAQAYVVPMARTSMRPAAHVTVRTAGASRAVTAPPTGARSGLSLPALARLRARITQQCPLVGPLSSAAAATLEHDQAPSPSTAAAPEGDNKQINMVEGLGRGLACDIKAKARVYPSELTDSFSIKVVSSTVFMFFACIAPAVAFGGLMTVATGGAIGTMEMLTATSVSGIVYALTSGQPLTIIGSTGPALAFTVVLYRLAAQMGLPFLPLYGWVGLWSSGILLLCSLFSVSNVVQFFSRFTDDIFSLLISVIFIWEAVKDLGGLFVNPAVPFVNATWSLIIASTTFGLAKVLNSLRPTKYFNNPTRELLADFAPTIGVFTGVFMGLWGAARYGVKLPTLSVPVSFATTSGRPWLVPLLDLPVWARWAAAVPALMGSILLFMDQTITVRLVNSKRHKMKKGYGMHMDMLAIAGITAGCSLTGLPWLVAATVRSLAHVKALAVYKTEGGKESIERMTEQRGSGVAVHVLMGLSILYGRKYLSKVPLAVLMGLFMYLGANGVKGNQLWERCQLLITDPKRRPKAPWTTNKFPVKRAHLYTIVQLLCLYAMVFVKSSKIGVLFPVLIALLAPIRLLLEKTGLFTKDELEVLDSDNE